MGEGVGQRLLTVAAGVPVGLMAVADDRDVRAEVLPPARARVGSAVDDATRGFGGTLGVAVVVSLSSSLYADRLLERLGAGDEQ